METNFSSREHKENSLKLCNFLAEDQHENEKRTAKSMARPHRNRVCNLEHARLPFATEMFQLKTFRGDRMLAEIAS